MSTTRPGAVRVAYAAYAAADKTIIESQDFAVDGDIGLDDGALVWTGGKCGRVI